MRVVLEQVSEIKWYDGGGGFAIYLSRKTYAPIHTLDVNNNLFNSYFLF